MEQITHNTEKECVHKNIKSVKCILLAKSAQIYSFHAHFHTNLI